MDEERVFQVHGKNEAYMDQWNEGFMRFMRDNPSARAELIFYEQEAFHSWWGSGVLTSIGYKVSWDGEDEVRGLFE